MPLKHSTKTRLLGASICLLSLALLIHALTNVVDEEFWDFSQEINAINPWHDDEPEADDKKLEPTTETPTDAEPGATRNTGPGDSDEAEAPASSTSDPGDTTPES